MKSNTSKSTQKRSSKKFKTTVKDSGPIFTNKLRTSIKNGTTKPSSQIPIPNPQSPIPKFKSSNILNI